MIKQKLPICQPSHIRRIKYLSRYKWLRCLTAHRNRRGPPWSWTLDITRSGTAKHRRHARRDRHPDRHRAHRMHHHSGIRKRWHRTSRVNRRGRPARDPSLRMRRRRGCIWWGRPEGTRHARCTSSSWPATWRHVASRCPRWMLLRHFELLRITFCFTSLTDQHCCTRIRFNWIRRILIIY